MLLYSLGFAMASDRIFQMDKLRRLSQGRLSEILGEKAINIDKMMRNLGFRDVAHVVYNGLNPDARTYLENFSSGVNDYLEFFSVGIEYWLLGIEFEKWEPKDSASIFILLSFMLSDGFKTDIYREYLYSKLKNFTLVDQIFPFDQKYELNISKSILNDDELKEAGLFEKYIPKDLKDNTNSKFYDFIENNIDEELDFVREIVDFYSSGEGASDCWAVKGDHTKSGRSILVNDPHLDPTLPSPFYVAELNVNDQYIIGALFPGVPIFGSFRTNNFSLGVTTLNADNSDLFEETINGTMYLSKGEWQPIIIREEEIKVKGFNQPIKIIIRSTHHGPILDHYGSLFHHVQSMHAPLKVKGDFSLSWTGYFTGSNSVLNCMTNFWKIKTVKEAIDLVKGKPDSSFGICLSDSLNNIGWVASTAFPIRPFKADEGRRILDGSSGEHDWKGLVPVHEIPSIINPKKGYVFSTNNRVSSKNTKHKIGANQPSNGRAIRADYLLNDLIHIQKKKIDANDMKMMLGDVYDVYASLKVPLLISIVEKDNSLDRLLPNKKAVEQVKKWLIDLKNWNYKFELELKEPTIFSLWEFYIVDNLFKSQIKNDKLRRISSKYYGYDDFLIKFLVDLHDNPFHFSEHCREEGINRANSCTKMVVDGIIFVYNYLVPTDATLSDEGLKFKYWHKVEYKYAPFSNTFLRIFFNRDDYDEGSKNTLNVGSIYYYNFESNGLESKHTPNYRMIVDFGNDQDCQFSLDTGVSENILGYFYFNLHESYKSLQMIPMGFNSLNTTQTKRFGTLRLIYKDWYTEEEDKRKIAKEKDIKQESEEKEDL